MRMLLGLTMVCIAASAGAQSPPAIKVGDDDNVARILAQTAHAVLLDRSTEDVVLDRATGYQRRSDQRVTLLVLDHGASTDASPRWALYLTVFNDINEVDYVWALEPVAWAQRFDGARRRSEGVYVAEIMTIDETGTNCGLVPAKVVIDARDLIGTVREGRGPVDGDFHMGRIRVPVPVTVELDKC